MFKNEQKRICNGTNRQLTKLTRNIDDLKNKSLYLYEDTADYYRIDSVKAVRLG